MGTKRTPIKKAASRAAGTVVLNINLPADLLANMDAWTTALNNSTEGPRWTRTDVIRTVLTRAYRERGQQGEAP